MQLPWVSYRCFCLVLVGGVEACGSLPTILYLALLSQTHRAEGAEGAKALLGAAPAAACQLLRDPSSRFAETEPTPSSRPPCLSRGQPQVHSQQQAEITN